MLNFVSDTDAARIVRVFKIAILQLMLTPLVAVAGQSIQLNSAYVSNDLVAALPSGQPWSVEFYLHDWAPSPAQNSLIAGIAATGLNAQLINTGGGSVFLQMYVTTETGGSSVCIAQIGSLPVKGLYVRYQHANPAGSDSCELWDIDAKRIFGITTTYTGNTSNFKGVQAGGIYGENRSFGFFRICSGAIAMNSRMPTTAGGCGSGRASILEWKFDGDLSDSSGNGYAGKFSSGQPVYTATPYQKVVSILKTAGAPVWSDWVSLRAGHSNQLDGTASFSQTDLDAGVSCKWQLVSGASRLIWENATTCTPTVQGAVFGDYEFLLTVTDRQGQQAVSRTHVGAVAMDDDGVVIPSDPRVTEIFGPMIAFGKNPWGYADERAYAAVKLQSQYYKQNWPTPPSWTNPGQGTVSYAWAGVGPSPGLSGTRLSAPVTSTSTTLVIADASSLDLFSLPTWIMVGNFIGQQEMVRICSTTSTTGSATLTVCYDGRGLSGPNVIPAQAWPQETTVGQTKVKGTGTMFASDPRSPICPAGVPGPPGPVKYSTGSVALQGSSANIVGFDTSWNTNLIAAGDAIRIQATHGGGTPFVWWSTIRAINTAGNLTANRLLPADVDQGPFQYQILSYRYIALHFQAPDGADQLTFQYTQGCESESELYIVPAHSVYGLNQQYMTGQQYTYFNSLGAQSAFGANFYGSGFASRAFYYRSGLRLAQDTANMMDDYWAVGPELSSGWTGGIPLLQGGGVIGAFANLILNRDTKLKWTDLRQFAVVGAYIGTTGCNDFDSRDSGYLMSWVALAANYDPDPAQRTIWKSGLKLALQHDQTCAGSDNSWANGAIYNSASPNLTVKNGSPTVTGRDLTQSLCYGIASGIVSVTNGASSISGSGLVAGSKIVLSGSRNGKPFTGAYAYSLNGGSSGTLAVLWPGDSGTVNYIIENSEYLTTIGLSNDDPQLRRNWACVWNSPTQITLNRTWDGPDTSNAHIYSYVLAGYGQQPFMLGVKLTAMRWASQNEDPVISSGYRELMPKAAAWVHDVGYDPVTQGLFYGRVFEFCEPSTTPPANSTFNARTPGCNNGLDPASIRTARVLSAEASSVLSVFYQSNPSQQSKDWADRVYGSIWGYAPFTTGGVYTDSNYVRDENSDNSLAAYKWPGFFFGMGMAHQWPAIRLNKH